MVGLNVDLYSAIITKVCNALKLNGVVCSKVDCFDPSPYTDVFVYCRNSRSNDEQWCLNNKEYELSDDSDNMSPAACSKYAIPHLCDIHVLYYVTVELQFVHVYRAL